MANEIERRAFKLSEFRVNDGGDGVIPMITGHAAVFNQLSENLGGFVEQITPGAFTDAIQTCDVRALFNHDPNFVLGRNKSGTLRLAQDATGLMIECDMPDTQCARDLMVSMKRGDISQMSFGFRVMPGDSVWTEENGLTVRTINKASLFDVSPVTYPAYPQTDCAVRSLNEWKASQETDSKAFEATCRKYQQANELRFGPLARK